MKNTLLDLYRRDGTKKLLASLLSILAGLLVGSLIVVIVALPETSRPSPQTAFGTASVWCLAVCSPWAVKAQNWPSALTLLTGVTFCFVLFPS